MKRNALTHLTHWLKRQRRKPLVLRGARQVGKSTLVRMLAKTHKLHLVEFNLEIEKITNSNTEEFDMTQLIAEIEAKKSVRLNSKCLLFFDEIQQQATLLPLLRYFYEKRPDIPVIAAGSLLEFTLAKHNFSMPVGRIEYFHLGPLSFDEFLLALNKDQLIEQIKDLRLQEFHYKELTSLFKDYLFVGGMPEAVQVYLETRSPLEVRSVHRSIIQTYRDDFPKYSTPATSARLDELFNRLHLFIGKKIKYSELLKETRSRETKTAVQLLEKARLLHFCKHTNASGLPLRSQADGEVYKLYFLDVGLLNYLQGASWEMIQNFDNASLLTKGEVAEQFVAQHLAFIDRGLEAPELFYWLKDRKSEKAEIDFLIEYDSKIFPIEVKAGQSGKLKSLVQFCYEKKLSQAYRFDLADRSKNKTSSETVEHKLIESEKTKKVHFELTNLHLGLISAFIGRIPRS